MPVANVKSVWSSGNLIFKRKYSATAASISLGEDESGLDFKVFGDTASKYVMWDASANQLIVAGSVDLGDSVDTLAYVVGGTAGVDFTSGAITNLEVIKGIVTYAV